MSGRDVLRGPRGDSSTAISDGEAFSSHPRPPWASIQVIHPDDKEKDREVFSEVHLPELALLFIQGAKSARYHRPSTKP
jgi:hypothetical protein